MPDILGKIIVAIIKYAIFFICFTFSNVNGVSPLFIFINKSSKCFNIILYKKTLTIKSKKPVSTYNRGTNAYSEATNFFSTLKQENEDMTIPKESSKQDVKKTKTSGKKVAKKS